MYLKIHPFERPEHGLKHSEDEVGPTEGRIEHDSDDHLEGVGETQEHNLDTNLEEPLEKAEPKQGVGLETLKLSVCVFSKRSSQRPETKE